MCKNLKYFTYLFLFSVLFSSTYEITILLDDYSGLFQGAKVLSNQEKIGKIKLIEQNNDGKWLVTLKIYEEYQNINSDMLFTIEGSSLFIDYAGMKLREAKAEEDRLAKIEVEEEKARQLKAAEEEKARQLKAAEEKAQELKAAEEEKARQLKAAEEEARFEKEKSAKIDAEEELLLLIKAEEERLAKIKAEEEEIRRLKIEQQQIASANADRERRKAAEARDRERRKAEEEKARQLKAAEEERLAKFKAIEKAIEIDSIKSEIRHFYIYWGTHSHKFKNETFQNNLGNVIDEKDLESPISFGLTGNIYRKFPFKFKYNINYSETSYMLLDEISFNINDMDNSSLDSDGDGQVVFDEYDNVDFSLTSFNSSISFDLLPKSAIRPFIGAGYSYNTLEFNATSWVGYNADFNRKQTFGNEFYIVNLIYEWNIAEAAINAYFDLSYRFSIKESELSFENIQFNVGIGK